MSRRTPISSARWIARRPSGTPSGWPSTTKSERGSIGSRTARCSGWISTWAFTSIWVALSPCAAPATGEHPRTTSVIATDAWVHSPPPTDWGRSRSITGSATTPRSRSRCRCLDRSPLRGASRGGDAYADRKAVTEALIPIVNAELKALAAAGVDFLQLDQPSFACHPDAPDQFLDLIARTVHGVSAYISMHMCFSNYRARTVGHRS